MASKSKKETLPDPYYDDEDAYSEEDEAPQKARRKKGRGFFAAMKSLWTSAGDEDKDEPSGPMEGEEDHWVALSLEQLLDSDPDALLHIISLRDFANALGPVWEKIGSKAMMIAESTIRLQAGHAAKIRQHDPQTFLVLFPNMSPENGRRKAFDISVLLGKKLVGAKFQIVGAGGAMGIGLVSLPGAILLDDDGGLSDEVVNDAAAAAPQVSDTAEAGVWLSTEGKAEFDPELLKGKKKGEKPALDNWLQFKVKQKKNEIRFVPIEAPKRRKSAEPEWVPIRKEPRP